MNKHLKITKLDAVQPNEIEKAWDYLKLGPANLFRLPSEFSVADAKAFVRELEGDARVFDRVIYAYALEASQRLSRIDPEEYRSVVSDAIEGFLAYEIINAAEEREESREDTEAEDRREFLRA